jgi:hypothetical protein
MLKKSFDLAYEPLAKRFFINEKSYLQLKLYLDLKIKYQKNVVKTNIKTSNESSLF